MATTEGLSRLQFDEVKRSYRRQSNNWSPAAGALLGMSMGALLWAAIIWGFTKVYGR